jgi:hypothetical protein
MKNPLVQDAVALLAEHGFAAKVRNGGKHIKLCWRDADCSYSLIIPRSPSDWRSRRNSRATLRRILRAT